MLKIYNKQTIKTALNMAVPAIIESFFVAFVGLVDSFMVSSLGFDSVAAVGLTTQPKFVGFALFIAINVAVSAITARRLGERRKRDANALLSSVLALIPILSLLVSLLAVKLASPIMKLCGSTPETHSIAVTYFSIIMGGMFFNCMQMCINAMLRGAGNTKITMRTNIVSKLINDIFNYLLIGGKFGFPRLGIAGAAIATVLGTIVACIMSIVSLSKADAFISLRYIIKNRVRPTLRSYIDIFKMAYSVFIEQLLLRVGFVATAVMAAKQGNDAMAAHQVGMNILGLSFSFGDGLQAAAVALIGRSLGEGRPEKAKEYGGACRFIGACISVAVAAVYLFGARTLMRLFFDEPHIVDIGVAIMYVAIIITLFQIQQVVYMGCLRGAGDTLYTAAVSAISVTVIRTVVSYVFGFIVGWGFIGIWFGVLADQLTRFMLSALRFKAGKWIMIKV